MVYHKTIMSVITLSVNELNTSQMHRLAEEILKIKNKNMTQLNVVYKRHTSESKMQVGWK